MADSPTPQELEADVARQREQMAQTIDQLTERLDVRTRIGTREIAAAGGAVVLVVLLIWWRRRG